MNRLGKAYLGMTTHSMIFCLQTVTSFLGLMVRIKVQLSKYIGKQSTTPFDVKPINPDVMDKDKTGSILVEDKHQLNHKGNLYF